MLLQQDIKALIYMDGLVVFLGGLMPLQEDNSALTDMDFLVVSLDGPDAIIAGHHCTYILRCTGRHFGRS